jgi:acyl carrier protein
MDENSIKDILFAALQHANQKEINRSAITDTTTLRDDLDMDSLALIEAVWEIEEKLQIHINEKNIQSFTTVGEVVRMICDLVNNKASEK